jgi:broad specificity phosphatase PhoE
VNEPPFGVRAPFLFGNPDATLVTLARHGQQAYPVADHFDPVAWADPPLSDIGVRQAQALGRALAGEQIDVVACSELSRARSTAEIAMAGRDVEWIIDHELREIDSFRDLEFGQLPVDHLPHDEWQERQRSFLKDRRWDAMPFSESSADFRMRVLAALNRVIEAHPGGRILIVSHGGVINSYIADLLGLDEDLFFLPHHCSITEAAVHDDIRRLRSINEHRHLEPDILTN